MRHIDMRNSNDIDRIEEHIEQDQSQPVNIGNQYHEGIDEHIDRYENTCINSIKYYLSNICCARIFKQNKRD